MAMASLSVFALFLTASAYNPEFCPPSAEIVPGSVGECDVVSSPCPSEKGPTQCIENSCICDDGYCSYGSASAGGLYCAARAIGQTCQRQGDCQEAGSGTTLCVQGLCLCVWNYRFNGLTRKCEKGWEPIALAMNGNYSSKGEMGKLRGAFEDKDAVSIAFNIGMFSAGVAAVLTLYSALRKSSGQVKEDDDGYQHLEGSTATSLTS